MKLLFLDCETTGIKDPYIKQVAYIHVPSGREFAGLFKPPVPIESQAAAITGISDETVKDCEPWEGSAAHAEVRKFLEEGAVFVAHNAKFDIKVIERYGMKVNDYICTMKLARWLLPNAPNHKLTTLFSHLNLQIPGGRGAQAHDALGDILMMRSLLKSFVYDQMVKMDCTMEEAIKYYIAFCKNPLLKTMPFGKHKGMPFKDLPRSYIAWLRDQTEMDDEVRFSIAHYFPA